MNSDWTEQQQVDAVANVQKLAAIVQVDTALSVAVVALEVLGSATVACCEEPWWFSAVAVAQQAAEDAAASCRRMHDMLERVSSNCPRSQLLTLARTLDAQTKLVHELRNAARTENGQ